MQKINGQELRDTTFTDFPIDSFTTDSSMTPSLSSSDDLKWYSMLTNLPSDFNNFGKEIFSSPAALTIAGLTALTALLIHTDEYTAHASYKYYRESNNFKKINDGITLIGDGRFHLLFAAAMGTARYLTEDTRMIKCASQLVEAELATGITVQLLKRITGRESPQAATSRKGRYKLFPSIKQYNEHQQKYYSFPSGHVSTTMAAVTVIAENFPEQKWIKPVGYATVGLVGISLVNKGWHWYSDFPLAVAIGYLFGNLISHKDDPNENMPIEKELSIHPGLSDGIGVSISYHIK